MGIAYAPDRAKATFWMDPTGQMQPLRQNPK